MGERIVLRTGCRDNGEAIGVLARDLEQGDLVLHADHAVEVGSWVAFEVLLDDGQAFLEGMGRCVRSQGNGTGHRVRLDDLQLDVAGEMLFERIVMARDDLDQGGRITGEIDISRLAEMTGVTAPVPPAPPKSAVPPPKPSPVTPPALPSAAKSALAPKPPALPPRPASALPQKPKAALPPKSASVLPPKPASALPPSPLSGFPQRSPSVVPPRVRPPSIVPTSPGGLAAVRPASRPPTTRTPSVRPPAVRPPSVRPPAVRPASVRPPAGATRSGLPPAPRVPTFAPTPFVPEDDTRVAIEAPELPPEDTRVSEVSRDLHTEQTKVAVVPALSSKAASVTSRLEALLPRLVAEGRVRNVEELRELALRIGLDALDTVYPD
ncbi:MAG: hypothetical protein H6721_19540 [Sandaracinus sp.]|nr:hypothetical protein [Sandaracinus sp.]MCB9634323.1 hypothetical protein [Sandaracinus sp.]